MIILLIHGRQVHIDLVVNFVVYVIHGILVYYKNKSIQWTIKAAISENGGSKIYKSMLWISLWHLFLRFIECILELFTDCFVFAFCFCFCFFHFTISIIHYLTLLHS